MYLLYLYILYIISRDLKRSRVEHPKFSVEMAGVKLFIALVVISAAIGGKWVGAQVHHVVAGDRAWDPSSGVGSWSSGRIFRVGDKIWFNYRAAQDNVVELKSWEEFLSCDLSNPIKMYTEGLNIISLEGEGIRYFASGKPESCKNGLKLHVEVQAQEKRHETSDKSAVAIAAGPTAPSASPHLIGVSNVLLFVGLLICYVGP
uniref:Putative Copper binding protein 9 n=1 Tax=Davidia involucrata TaxID=16924 RepID=A0A5B7C2C1_DAVIN